MSKRIGSRNAQTIAYIFDNKIQIVCGCWKGDLQAFEARVKEVHGENKKYLKEYTEYIKLVKVYAKYCGVKAKPKKESEGK